jgi:membrane-associated phospholipid phosphatase
MQEICIPPSSVDRAIARTAARYTSPSIQKVARLATWAGDKHLLIGLAAAYWLGSRRQGARRRVQANHLLSTVVLASGVPGVLKSVIDQERPDRCMVGPQRKGIETSGKARDAFPSGHAVNMGAAASALAWIYPDKKLSFWALAAAVGATRVAILAHWASDVLVGAALGAGLEAATRQVANRRLRALPERSHHG